jgi:pSer/pThr/pTyr-binding forkhead associated (FHA) protein
MSLVRLIIWSSLIGGWSAFFGWLFSEVIFHRWIDNAFVAIAVATMVAIPIGGGICVVSGLTNPRLDVLAKRLGLGFAGGLLGGLLGALIGSCMFGCFHLVSSQGFVEFVARVVGWTLIGVGIGAGIGVSEGIFDRSWNKFRNGIIGGVLGGFLGGLFFGIVTLIGGSITSRAFSFVLLGLCIGFFIGLAQVILIEAGFRPGRQMILGKEPITMGTSEKAGLIFIAYGAKGVEPIHLKITKLKDGGFALEDNQSRTGTLLNGQPVRGSATLNDGDAIQFGVNVVRFRERVKRSDAEKLPPPVVTQPAPASAIPAEAITAKPPAPRPAPAAPAPGAAIQAPPRPAPAPAPKPAAAAPPKPQEARCPICDKVIVGLPGQRRCGKCFTTF